MKKYLLGLAAVILALSLSAFTGESKEEVKVGKTNMHWFVAPYGPGDFQETTSSAVERTGQINCKLTGQVICERAFSDAQLEDSGDPEAGVDPDEKNSPTGTIYRP